MMLSNLSRFGPINDDNPQPQRPRDSKTRESTDAPARRQGYVQDLPSLLSMAVLNRCAVAVAPRQPMLDWARPFRGALEDQAQAAEESLYLISPFDDEHQAQERLRDCHGAIFEAELELWCRDRALWPRDRGLERFLEWFAVHFHHLVEDLGSEPLRRYVLESSVEEQLRQALG